jgi:hypothetical protein
MDSLVQRLSEGDHPVEISLRPERTIKYLKDCLDRQYVHVKFTGTRGGTELGFPLDQTESDLTRADLDAGKGRLRLVGNLTLNYVPVRCIAEIDLETLDGVGRLQVADAPAPAAAGDVASA